MEVYVIMMMDLDWWRSTISWSNTNTIWKA